MSQWFDCSITPAWLQYVPPGKAATRNKEMLHCFIENNVSEQVEVN